MSRHTVTMPLHIQLWEASEHELEARITYSFLPGNPGRLSGPPENCYPPEPDEVDIERIELRYSKETPWHDANLWLEVMLSDDETLTDFLASEAVEALENGPPPPSPPYATASGSWSR